ncbi:MAG: sensor domain-containing diguanylate cyclase [Candidatus Omnitrophica bacterium]|nr:sensor domain-containing diguanylate cyclase [Candidatus Omnitrophota bacterium]
MIFIVVCKIRTFIISQHQGEFENFDEKINILNKSIEEKNKILNSFPKKSERASFLFDISKSLIELIELEEIFNSLIKILEKLFPEADSILIFSFDKEGGALELKHSLKRKFNTIKEKKGSSLDNWVLHQNRSLLIEDITKDFRFDASKLTAYYERRAHSFVLSPLSVGRRSLGLVRIESQRPGEFSLDDSRLLRNVCDLGVVVLERSVLFKKIKELATKDALTGLFVRSYFSEYFSRELKLIQRQNGRLGLIMLDIDDFKKINDTHGHVVGDLVIVKLADILQKSLTKRSGIVSRFGGEEFTLLLLEISLKELVACAEEIRYAVAAANLAFRRKKIQFTVSLGAALYPDNATTPTGLIEEADRALYKAKREGKNKTCYSGQ